MRKRRQGIKTLTILLIIAVAAAFLWQPAYNIFLKSAYPDKYKEYVTLYAEKNGVEPSLVYAVIKSESSFDPNAVSKVGAIGLMQVTPPTLEWIMKKSNDSSEYTASDLYDPEINIRYGTAILAELLKEYNDEKVALAAYHAGRANVRKWLSNPDYSKDGKTLNYIPFSDTRAYVSKVKNIKEIYKKLYYGNK
ncbi:MAG: lytic transglycosylase domain-containing protein [[Clostridium] cellulosi]|nr:MAG: lytic transglycosylase [[Clostridium] cellulosi]